jgi:enolase
MAIAFGSPIIKTGVVGGERVAKINELCRIEKDLGQKIKLAKIER